MPNGLSRLKSRFLANPADVERARMEIGQSINAEKAQELGLVTFVVNGVDGDDEIRLFLEQRTSFSPDALTGMEASLRFAGPETMESKIFARPSAWQKWILQRPTAGGAAGALTHFS